MVNTRGDRAFVTVRNANGTCRWKWEEEKKEGEGNDDDACTNNGNPGQDTDAVAAQDCTGALSK